VIEHLLGLGDAADLEDDVARSRLASLDGHRRERLAGSEGGPGADLLHLDASRVESQRTTR